MVPSLAQVFCQRQSYSAPVSFSNADFEANPDHDPKGSSPGWGDPKQSMPVYFQYKLVGNIHSHLPKSGPPTNPINENFSGRDEKNQGTSSNMDFYLATPKQVLKVYRGRDVETNWGPAEPNHITVPLGQMSGGTFQPNGYFEGTVNPIKTGAARDVIYGFSVKKEKK